MTNKEAANFVRDAIGISPDDISGDLPQLDAARMRSLASMLKRKTDEAVNSDHIRYARKIMRDQLKDPGLRLSYLANISMVLRDHWRADMADPVQRNAAAEAVLKLLFSE